MKPIRVLLVEDDDNDAALVELTLTRTGLAWKITRAATLAAAVLAVPKVRPEVILLDINLPNGKGEITIQTMRDAAPEVPIVSLTGAAPEQYRAIAEAAAESWLGKNDATRERILEAIADAGRMMRARLEARGAAIGLHSEAAGVMGANLEGAFAGACRDRMRDLAEICGDAARKLAS